MTDTLLTLAEVGEKLRRGERVVKRLLFQNSDIVPVRIGRSLMLTPVDFERLVEKLKQPLPSATNTIMRHDVRKFSVKKLSSPSETTLEAILRLTQKKAKSQS